MVVRNMYSCTKIVEEIGASCWFVYTVITVRNRHYSFYIVHMLV
jgi:hypothetical protein